MEMLVDALTKNAGSILTGLFTLFGAMLGVWATVRSQAKERRAKALEGEREAIAEAIQLNKEWITAAEKVFDSSLSPWHFRETMERPHLNAHHCLAKVILTMDDQSLRGLSVKATVLHETFMRRALEWVEVTGLEAHYEYQLKEMLKNIRHTHSDISMRARRKFFPERFSIKRTVRRTVSFISRIRIVRRRDLGGDSNADPQSN